MRKQDKASAEIEALGEQVILKMDEKKFTIDRHSFLKEWKIATNSSEKSKDPLVLSNEFWVKRRNPSPNHHAIRARFPKEVSG